MKTSKFTDAQIAFVLRQAEEGTAIGEVCRKAGISEATFYNWRKKYGGLMPSEMRRLSGASMDFRSRSASTRAASSCHASWISGRTSAA